MSACRSVLCAAALPQLAAIGSVAMAQQASPTGPDPVFFDKLEETSVRVRREAYERIESNQINPGLIKQEVNKKQHSARFEKPAARSAALDEGAVFTAIEAASAAIKTSVDGAEAGITVSPLALLGDNGPNQIVMTFAALSGMKTRYGLGYSYLSQWEPLDAKALGLEHCVFTPEVDGRVRADIKALRPAYQQVCRTIIANVSKPPVEASAGSKQMWNLGQAACGYQPYTAEEPELTFKRGTRLIAALIAEGVRKNPTVFAEFKDRLSQVDASLELLAEYSMPPLDSCISDKQIGDAYQQGLWDRPRLGFGFGGQLDLFPQVFGFNPDPESRLARGDLGAWKARAEVSRVSGSFELHLGLAIGQGAEKLGDPLRTLISPSVSLVATVASLVPGVPLRDSKGRLKLYKGELPPQLSLGLDFSCDIAPNPPDSQVRKLQKVRLTLFADFKMTEKLAFRIGVPLFADTVIRKENASQGIAEKRDLQWSIPVFATAVIKI